MQGKEEASIEIMTITPISTGVRPGFNSLSFSDGVLKVLFAKG